MSERATAGISSAVGSQDFRRVVCRVEAEAQQMGLLLEPGIRGQLFLDVSEIAAHADAIVGKRATGVDESDQQGLAAKLRQVDGLAVLVDEVKIGNLLPLG